MNNKKLKKQKKHKKSRKRKHHEKSSAKPRNQSGNTSQMKLNLARKPATSKSVKKKKSSKGRKKGKSKLKMTQSNQKIVDCKENAPPPPPSPKVPEKQVETILIAPDDYFPIYSYKTKPKNGKETSKTSDTKKDNDKQCSLKPKTAESTSAAPKVRYNAPDFQHVYNRSKGQKDKVNMKEEVVKACRSPQVDKEDDDSEDDDEDESEDDKDDVEGE